MGTRREPPAQLAPDLALLKRCLAVENSVLRESPRLLFQCLWNGLANRPGLSANLRAALDRSRERSMRDRRAWLRRLNRLRVTPEIMRFDGHQRPLAAVGFSADGRRVLSIDDRGTGIVWDAETGRVIFSFTSKIRGVGRAHFSKDGANLLVAGRLETEIRDALSGASRGLLPGGWGLFVVNGTRVITNDGRTWDLASAARCADIQFPYKDVKLLGLSSDETCLFAVCDGRPAIIIRASGRTERLLHPGKGWASQGWTSAPLPMTAASCSPDGRRWAFSNAGQTCLWKDGLDGDVLYHHQIGMVLASAFSPDGRELVLGCENGICLVVSAETGQVLGAPNFSSDRTSCLAFSPDGGRVVTGYFGGVCVVWENALRASGGSDVVEAPPYLTLDEGDTNDQAIMDPCITFVSFSRRGTGMVAAGRNSEPGTWEELEFVDGLFRRREVPGRWLDTDGHWPCSTLEGSTTSGRMPWPAETLGKLVRPNKIPSLITSDGKYRVVVDPGLGRCRVLNADEESEIAEYFARCVLWSLCTGRDPLEFLLGDAKGEVHWLKIEGLPDPPP